jgi:spermidine synthase
MRGVDVDSGREQPVSFATLLTVALISAALIAYEIVLMRRLLLESWHHFGYLVISVALLGFGASGTFLAVIEQRVRARPRETMFWLAAGLATGLVVMPRVASLLPVTARFIPNDLWDQVGWWSLYWLTALIPFLLGAAFLGAALMTAGRRVGRVYAANLFGSAVGAVGAILLVSYFLIEDALWPSFVLTILALLVLAFHARRAESYARPVPRVILTLALVALAALAESWWPLVPSYDEYKYAARLERLVEQGSARRVARRCDPHGYVELYESDLFHDLPFLALTEAPPPMYSLVLNGDPAGSVLRIKDAAEAAVMDGTLMAVPYRLVRPQPRVLLIGETGGANVWLGRRHAAQIDAVQPNAALVELVRARSGVLDTGVNVHVADPRRFLASADRPQCDLIQVVSLEGLGVGSAGMRGLAEDHLATVEGFADCLRALSDNGVLAVSRGIQEPARENIRIFATLVEALESLGVTDASRQMVQVRDYLGVCTIALKLPLDDARRQTLRTAIREFDLTPVWYDGLPLEDVNQPDAFDGPPGTNVDWLHYAASEILSPRREAFYGEWMLNVRPVHDDNPFFWDFYKPQGLAELKRVYGDLWLTRAELGRLFLYASLIVAGGAAVVLILLPLGIIESRRWMKAGRRENSPRAVVQDGNLAPADVAAGPRTGRAHRLEAGATEGVAAGPRTGRAHRLEAGATEGVAAGPRTGRAASAVTIWTIIYFGGIGLGFMAIEMALISRAIRWVGDPVIASALVIGGVLLVSGIGSLTGGRIVGQRVWLAPAAVTVSAVVLRLVGWDVSAGPWLLLLVTLLAGYLMGMPMPAGLAALDVRSPRLVPWAWGLNGVASVIATSAAIVVAMTSGYRTVMLLAAAAYGLAALVANRLAKPTGSQL